MDRDAARRLLRERMGRGCTIRIRPSAGAEESHRGYEIRIHAKGREEETLLREALAALSIEPGKSYAKRKAWVVPCYGKKATMELLRIVGGRRAREALARVTLASAASRQRGETPTRR